MFNLRTAKLSIRVAIVETLRLEGKAWTEIDIILGLGSGTARRWVATYYKRNGMFDPHYFKHCITYAWS